MIWVNLLWVYSGFSVCRVYWKSGIFVTKEVSLGSRKTGGNTESGEVSRGYRCRVR